MLKHYLLVILSLFSFSLAANQVSVSVSDFTVREFIPGAPSSVGYFTIHNAGKTDKVLKSVTIEQLGRVEIHNHLHENGMMKMVQVSDLKIDAKSTVVFKSGGLHLMLFNPERKLVKGESLNTTLHFKDGTSVKTSAKVVGLAEQMNKAHHHHHHH